MKLLVLSHAQVESLLPMPACIDVMAEAFAALAAGAVHMPLRTMVRPPDSQGIMVVMPAYRSAPSEVPRPTSEVPRPVSADTGHGTSDIGQRTSDTGQRTPDKALAPLGAGVGQPAQGAYGLKAICVFPGNPRRGLDAHQGATLLYSGETGELLAAMNASAITAIRTAAVSGLATRLLARPDAGDLAILGSGVQARAHLAAMAAVRPLRRARVASLTPVHAAQFVAEQAPRYPFPVVAVANAAAAVEGADLIVTATTSAEPVLRREWLAPGSHINAVGAFTPATREVDSATVSGASLFVDSREAAQNEAGDYLIPLREGAIAPDHIRAELSELVGAHRPGRTAAGELTLFKSLGIPVEDLFAAQYLYARALESGAGTWVDFA